MNSGLNFSFGLSPRLLDFYIDGFASGVSSRTQDSGVKVINWDQGEGPPKQSLLVYIRVLVAESSALIEVRETAIRVKATNWIRETDN